jgi:hypothetical protein
MSTRRSRLLLFVPLVLPTVAMAATTVAYVFTSEATTGGRAPVTGSSRVTSTIDGSTFRNVSRLGNAVELSEDDGRTTYFGSLHTTPHTPLLPEVGGVTDPIVGSVRDESLVVGPSVPGPAMFGLPTRTYTVDYSYAIVARVLMVITNETRHHAHFTFTVADVDVSSAALRVAFSRGYGYALCLHPEAFTGLPLAIDGTIASSNQSVHVHVEAEAIQR